MKKLFEAFLKWFADVGEALLEQAEVKYVSWYQDARPYYDRQYLCKYPTGEGYWYSSIIANAYRFDTYEEAKAVTPVYDGSGMIEERTGVIKVYN